MKLFYAIAIVLMVFVSACGKQAPEPDVSVVTPGPTEPTLPEPSPPEEGDVTPPEEGGEAPIAGDEVRMMGVGQYEPEEVTISAGGSITFFNDGEHKTAIMVKGPSNTTNTPLVEAGDKYEQVFEEAGEYEVWALAYGPGIKVTVE